jgi:(S)-ureidoglycine aminohydrolase
MQKATAIVHAAPALGARFTEYTAEFEAGGSLEPASAQRFVYVLDGELQIDGALLASGGYAYFPPRHAASPRQIPREPRLSRSRISSCPA